MSAFRNEKVRGSNPLSSTSTDTIRPIANAARPHPLACPLYTAAIGFALAALMLRGSAIWPLIIVHGLIDFVSFMSDPAITANPVVEASVNAVITVAFVGYGLWVLRRPSALDAATPAPAESALAR